MARKLVVEIVGDARSLERAFDRSSRSAKQFDTTMTGTVRRVDAGFTKLQRVAAGGFLGGAAVGGSIALLKRFNDAAIESEAVLGQTQVALANAGLAWSDYGEAIDKAITAQSRSGFDDEDLLRSFSLFVRQTRDVDEALRRNQISMDLARARFIDLAAAANIVNKAALGQAGALRRIGIDAQQGASGVELLAQLEREFAGAAEDAANKGIGAQERLAVSVENLEEKIGSGLIPVVSTLAEDLSDAADGATELLTALNNLKNARIPGIDVPINFTFPGTDSTVTDILKGGAKQALRTQFLGPTGAIALFVKDLLDGDDTNANTKEAAEAFDKRFNTFVETMQESSRKGTAKAQKAAKDVAAFGEAGFKPLTESAKQTRERLKEARDERNRLSAEAAEAAAAARSARFDALINGLQLNVNRAELTANLRDDLDALENLRSGLRRQVSAGVDVAQAQSELVSVAQQIAAKQAEIQQAAQEAAQASQFRAIGLSDTGSARVPTTENLRKQLEQLEKNLVGQDVPKKLTSRLAGVAKVLQGEFGKVTEASREAIRDLFQAIRDEFDKGSDGPITQASGLNTNKILAGLGLTPEAERELRQRLSGFNTQGLSLGNTPNTSGNFRDPTLTVVVENTTTLDGDVIARNTTRSQQATAKRNARQKVGPRSGI